LEWEPEEEEENNPNNLIQNGSFNGNEVHTWGWWKWLWSNLDLWWGAHISNSWELRIQDGKLFIETTWDSSYIEARNTNGWYHGVTDQSIAVKPNTTYIIEYDYETEYVSWDSIHGFSVKLLTQEMNGITSGEFTTTPFVKSTQAETHVKYEFTTSATANYLNVSPLIYGHTGDKTLQMKAWVDNMELYEKWSDVELELDELLKILFSDIEEGVNINYTPGCVPVESEECLQEAITETEAFRRINFILSHESKVEVVVNKLFDKVWNTTMEGINSLLIQKKLNGEYSWDMAIIVDMIITYIRIKLWGDAYLKWVQDALAINNLFDVAVWLWAWAAIITERLIEKYPEEIGKKLLSKGIPYVGWGLTVFMI
jgi:hypothetical protein